MITLEDMMRSMMEQTLSTLTSMQQGSIEAFHAWMKATAPLMPDLNLYHEMPTFAQDAIGNPAKIFDLFYEFMSAVLELNKEYMQEVYRASVLAPRTPMVPRHGDA